MWVGGKRHIQTALPPVPIVKEAWWVSYFVWTGAENLSPIGIQSPDRPARSELLSRPTHVGIPAKCILLNT